VLDPEPFLLSPSEVAATDVMRAEETIPQDWRYTEIPWQPAPIFDRIIEIGGPDIRLLSCDQLEGRKCGEIVFGPDASKRLNERAAEIRDLFDTDARPAEADASLHELV